MVIKEIVILNFFFAVNYASSGQDKCKTICGIICGFCRNNANICPPVINNDCKCFGVNRRYYNLFTRVVVAMGSTSTSTKDIEVLDDIEVIDTFSSYTVCKNLPNFPYKNFGSLGGLKNEDIPIICGGASNSTYCHSLQKGSWRPDANLTRKRFEGAMSLSPFDFDGSSLFVTGGSKYSEVLTENGWRPSTPLPVAIRAHCMVRNKTGVMVIGGHQSDPNKPDNLPAGQTISGHTFYFDGRSKVWSEGPSLNHKRIGHSCSMIKMGNQNEAEMIIVVGGFDERKPISSTEVLLDGAWQNGPELPFGISNAGLVQDYEKGVILIGGWTGVYFEGTNKVLDTFYKLRHGGPDGKWEEMPQTLKKPRRDLTAFMILDEFTNCVTLK